MEDFVEHSATVVEFAWRNPHAFAVVELDTGSEESERWLLEMNSKPILVDMGWTGETLKVGDRITVRGNPDRRTSRKQLFVAYVITAAGEKRWSFGRPRAERQRQSNLTPKRVAPSAGSTDYTGVWARARVPADHPSKKNPFGPSWLAVTQAGEDALAKFDINDDPAFECEPQTPPRTIVPVYPLRITRVSKSALSFEYEINNGYQEIHLGMRDHPAEVEPSLMGHSIGKFDYDSLVIRTKHFSYNRWGNGRGLPSSEKKELIERYTLVNNGKRLEVEYTVIDPVYLSEPAHDKGAFVLRSDGELTAYECDPRAAVRHLKGE